ncbi:GNAT family N-acetyltransferase [Lactobacillus sp. PV034]|nr:GNAT family N-acetyltransferase [Lactobacillus sp. PV034]
MPKDENGFENEYAGLTFDEFKTKAIPAMLDMAAGKNLPAGYVPATTYVLWLNGAAVGVFKLRHHLTDFLRQGPGHLGYGIKKEYRGQGLASQGLHLALEKAKSIIPEPELYLACHKDNPASLKVMQNNGGYLDHEDEKEYYVRIPLKE